MTTPENKLTTSTAAKLSALALATVVALQPTIAYAAITNDATATGTYGATTVDSAVDSETVPVAPAVPTLTIVKSVTTAPTVAAGVNGTQTDAGDTIVYGYVVTNTGNVTMTDVKPVDAQPQFNGVNGVNSFGAFTGVTLAPGASQAFSATYTLATLDVLRAADVNDGVTNVAVATGQPPGAAPLYTSAASPPAITEINGYSGLLIAKVGVLSDAGGGTGADVGETITYTYTITNTGTVPLTAVSVEDDHEAGGNIALGAGGVTAEALLAAGPLGAGASSNGTTNDGVWATLAAGASITMQYVHVVTQTEFNNQ